MDYLDYDLTISDKLKIAATFKNSTALAEFKLDKNEFKDGLTRLQDEENEADKSLILNLGKDLADAVFVLDVKKHFYNSKSQAGNRGLRIRLRIDSPDIADYPWEALCLDDKSIATAVDTSLTRIVPGVVTSRKCFGKPLNFLVICSNPSVEGLASVVVEREVELIESSLKESIARGEVNFKVERVGEVSRIMNRLNETQYNVIHFIGHGIFKNNIGYLALENGQGELDLADNKRIGQIFQNQNSLGLVVLNACQGASLSTDKAFSGLAAELVRIGVPSVVAMKYSITNSAARLFSGEFYKNLLRMPLDENMQRVRQRILVDPESTSRDYITPILFMNPTDFVVFTPEDNVPKEMIQRPGLDVQIQNLKETMKNMTLAKSLDARDFWLLTYELYETEKDSLSSSCRREIENMALRVPVLLISLDEAFLAGFTEKVMSLRQTLLLNYRRLMSIIDQDSAKRGAG